MSDSDRLSMRYKAEGTYGALETGNKFTNLRITSESLGQNSNFIESNEIVSDRQIADMARVGISAGGNIETELSYGAFDDLFAALLFDAAWNAAVTTISADTDISAADSDNSFNDSTTGFTGYVVNQWIQVSGFTDPANNGIFKIVSVTTAKMVVTGGTLVTEASGDSVTIEQGAYIENGTDFTSFNVEKDFEDLSTEFEILTGIAYDTYALAVTPSQILTGSFGVLGQDAASAGATTGDGSPTPAPTNPIMNAVSNVTAILENYSSYGSTNLTMNIANNLRSRLQIASLGAISIGAGKFVITGNLTAYFTTPAVMNKYLNNTSTSLALVLTDDLGNIYVIDMPQVKFTNGRRIGGGVNTDITANMDFAAYKHATEGKTMRMVRFPV